MASIQSTGVGSNLDVNSIISKLMVAESTPLVLNQQRQASYQADLTAYGTLQGALGSLQGSLSTLNNLSTFRNLTATVGDASILSASTNSTATAGSYNVNVTQLAQAQSITTTGQLSPTSAIGSGTSTTLTFQFGTISGGTNNSGKYTGASFTQDPAQNTGTVTIDSSNNSLQGIRDAINNAKIGVQAAIVGDGSATPYHLVLTSASTGQTSSMKISVSGDASLQSLLAYDPSGTQSLTELNTAQSAKMTINGLAVTSSSNSVSNAVQGVTFTATKIGTTSVSVSANTKAITDAVNNFVKAYNSLSSTVSSLTSYDPNTKKAGTLLGDATTQTIQNQIKSVLSSAVNGLGGGLTYLAQVGITFQRDGTLSVDNNKLQNALTNNFSDFAGLFTSAGKASDSLISYVGSGTKSQPGNYAINITQNATHGILTGNLNLNTSGSIQIAANSSIKVTIDGITSNVNLSEGTYTPSGLASMLQSAINGTSAFSSVGVSLSSVIDSNGFLNLTSSSYGSASLITLADNAGTPLSQITGSVKAGSPGLNVAGTINGIGATGTGQILTGASGSPSEGLQVLVSGGSTGDRGTLNFSNGFAYKLNQALTGILGTNGLLASATKGLNSSIKDLQNQASVISKRLTTIQAQYQAQFQALDTAVSRMSSLQAYLTQQINALNGTITSSK